MKGIPIKKWGWIKARLRIYPNAAQTTGRWTADDIDIVSFCHIQMVLSFPPGMPSTDGRKMVLLFTFYVSIFVPVRDLFPFSVFLASLTHSPTHLFLTRQSIQIQPLQAT
jgi:hypothetical protein